MVKFAVVLGTRPEVIKLSSIIRFLYDNNEDFFIVHSGQHYSYNLDKVFFEELDLPLPKYNLDVGSSSHAVMTSKIMVGLEKIFLSEKPDFVIVQGDTNTVLAGALTASKINIPVVHVEAGLRSYDSSMPEEVNRIVTDHISSFLFTPTVESKNILLKENISENKIFVVGNTIVDAVFQNSVIANRKVDVLKKLGLEEKKFFLLTMHRPSNVDFKNNIENVFLGLKKVFEKFGFVFVFPIHPRTKKNIEKFNIKIPSFIKVIEPVGFLEFLQLEKNSFMIFTDSGGVQEEACILNVPCITLRFNTERPETVSVGSNILSGNIPEKIFENSILMFKKIENNFSWTNPFGKGDSGERIIKILKENKRKV